MRHTLPLIDRQDSVRNFGDLLLIQEKEIVDRFRGYFSLGSPGNLREIRQALSVAWVKWHFQNGGDHHIGPILKRR